MFDVFGIMVSAGTKIMGPIAEDCFRSQIGHEKFEQQQKMQAEYFRNMDNSYLWCLKRFHPKTYENTIKARDMFRHHTTGR